LLTLLAFTSLLQYQLPKSCQTAIFLSILKNVICLQGHLMPKHRCYLVSKHFKLYINVLQG